MTNDEYRKIQAINYSALKVGRTSLPHMHAIITGTAERFESDSLSLGTLLHEAMQLGAGWSAGFAIRPDGIDRRTRIGKEAYAAWLNTLPADAKIVDSGDAATIAKVEAMRQAINTHQVARTLAALPGESEVTLVDGNRKACVDRLTEIGRAHV